MKMKNKKEIIRQSINLESKRRINATNKHESYAVFLAKIPFPSQINALNTLAIFFNRFHH